MIHTKGVWENKGLIVFVDGIYPTVIAQMICIDPTEEDYDNARLMARAKDMYHALKSIQKTKGWQYLERETQNGILQLTDLVEDKK
jgi:hypothetical protein